VLRDAQYGYRGPADFHFYFSKRAKAQIFEFFFGNGEAPIG
jgi:hypothetical protein